jgi:cytochrome c oxidase accessory protein FixG
MREQVCKYMCPYARFQGVMLDPDTVTVSYDAARGEPRGGRSKDHGQHHEGLGSCVDCGYCVQVCPTGIDIRNGIQIECLNCGLCVDACDAMMKKMDYPIGLICYTSQAQLFCKACNRITSKSNGAPCGSHAPNPLLRKRVFIYATLLILIVSGILTRVMTRIPVRLDVMRDRAVLSRETPDGNLENVYRLQVLNMAERARTFEVQISGLSGAKIEGPNQVIEVGALENSMVAVDVDVPSEALDKTRTPFTFTIIARDDSTIQASSQTLFFRP